MLDKNLLRAIDKLEKLIGLNVYLCRYLNLKHHEQEYGQPLTFSFLDGLNQ
jgi:hypothetical protein